MSWFGLVKPVVDSVAKVGEVFLGNKAKREEYAADENAAAMEQYAAEFNVHSKRTWFDSLIDGLNRLVRPVLVGGVIFIVSMAVWDTAWFVEIMVALSGVPENFWQLLFLVFGFYLTSRMVEKVSIDRVGIKKEEIVRAKEVAIEVNKMRAVRLSQKKKEGQEGDPQEQKQMENHTISVWKNPDLIEK